MTGVTSSHSNLASEPEDLSGFGYDFAFPGRDGRVSVDTAAGAMVKWLIAKDLSLRWNSDEQVFTSFPYI